MAGSFLQIQSARIRYSSRVWQTLLTLLLRNRYLRASELSFTAFLAKKAEHSRSPCTNFNLHYSLKIGCASEEKISFILFFSRLSLSLQHPRGEILGQECVSCFYPYHEIANFKGGVGTMRRSFCLRICKRCTALNGCTHFPHICYSVGYLFLCSFS